MNPSAPKMGECRQGKGDPMAQGGTNYGGSEPSSEPSKNQPTHEQISNVATGEATPSIHASSLGTGRQAETAKNAGIFQFGKVD